VFALEASFNNSITRCPFCYPYIEVPIFALFHGFVASTTAQSKFRRNYVKVRYFHTQRKLQKTSNKPSHLSKDLIQLHHCNRSPQALKPSTPKSQICNSKHLSILSLTNIQPSLRTRLATRRSILGSGLVFSFPVYYSRIESSFSSVVLLIDRLGELTPRFICPRRLVCTFSSLIKKTLSVPGEESKAKVPIGLVYGE
jgi:hypothetical protein